MIEALYVMNLDDDVTIYKTNASKGNGTGLHLYEDCSLAAEAKSMYEKKPPMMWKDTRICDNCTRRYFTDTEYNIDKH